MRAAAKPHSSSGRRGFGGCRSGGAQADVHGHDEVGEPVVALVAAAQVHQQRKLKAGKHTSVSSTSRRRAEPDLNVGVEQRGDLHRHLRHAKHTHTMSAHTS